jgi:hypothetical protein
MTLWVNSDRFAMFARCPLLTQQRPNRFVTASDVTDHKRALGYYLESSALMASSRSRSCGLKLWSASVPRPSEGSLKAVVVPEQFPVRRHETRRAENAEPLCLLSLRTQPGFVCVRSDVAVIDRRIRLPLPSRGRDGNLYVRFTGTT